MNELPRWRKSSRSNGSNSNCVEVADNLVGRVLVRDSKDKAGPTLAFAPAAWRSFVATLADRLEVEAGQAARDRSRISGSCWKPADR